MGHSAQDVRLIHLLQVPQETHVPLEGAVLSGQELRHVLFIRYPDTQLVQVVPSNEHVWHGGVQGVHTPLSGYVMFGHVV